MKRLALAAILLCGLTSACAFRSEVVERPVPARSTTAAVVVADPPPPATVYVPD